MFLANNIAGKVACNILTLSLQHSPSCNVVAVPLQGRGSGSLTSVDVKYLSSFTSKVQSRLQTQSEVRALKFKLKCHFQDTFEGKRPKIM